MLGIPHLVLSTTISYAQARFLLHSKGGWIYIATSRLFCHLQVSPVLQASAVRDSQITVGDVLNAFPLSSLGNYHIRFRRNNGSSYEWVELLDVMESAPTYNGGIFLKVLDLG